GTFAVDDGRENHPTVNVRWHGAAAFASFRSEMEGLEPCIDVATWECDFSKNGYRLPTEAEWEKSARGGLTGNHYPWPSYGGGFASHLDKSKANYGWEHDVNHSTLLGYYDGGQTPPGVDMANGYGMYDMAGNAREWVWDWLDEGW